MSIKIMSRVWELSPTNSSELLTMLALSDHADDEGVCWPSIPLISKKNRLSDRQTQRVLTSLEKSGHVFRHVGGGRRKTTIYVVACGMDAEVLSSVLITRLDMTPDVAVRVAEIIIEKQKGDILETVTSGGERVTPGDGKGDIPALQESPLTIIEPSLEPSLTSEFSELFPERNHPPFEKGPHTPEEARRRITKAMQSGNGDSPAEWVPEPLRNLALAFTQATGLTAGKGERGAWLKQLTILAGDGITPEAVGRAVARMNRDGLTIARPASVRAVARSMLIHHESEFIPTAVYE